MRRTLLVLAAVATLTLGLAAPAAAHVLVVDPPGQGNPQTSGWVGGPALPGQGKGLMPGGPTGADLLSASHAKGLNTACAKNGSSVVHVFGPPNSTTCPHGP